VTDNSPIQSPLPLLFKRFRYQVVPVLTLFFSMMLAGWLWMQRSTSIAALGEANAVRMDVNSKSDGVLVDLPRKIRLFDYVRAGEVVARLDNSILDAQIARLQSEIEQMRGEMELLSQSHSKGGKSVAVRSSGTASLPPVAIPAPIDGSGTDDTEGAMMVARTQATLRIAIATREAQIRELEQKILNHDLKAPMSGVVTEIRRVPGQAVTAGSPIVTIAADKPDCIIGYIRAPQQMHSTRPIEVDVRRRSDGVVMRTRVDTVGPQIEKVPDTQLRDHRTPEWGVPVRIAIPNGADLRPGEIVDLFFRTPSSGGGL
jgi:multidrug resistance efflux pump